MTTNTQAPEKHREDAAPLAAAMRKGDPASCRDFIAHFAGPLYNYLYWLSGDPESAADLFQQTMMAVYRNLGRVRKARSAETWVYRQATQLYFEQGRRQLQRKRSSWDNILKGGLDQGRDERWSQWDDSPSDVDDTTADRLPYLVDAMKHLGPRERAAILLAGIGGRPPKTIAECLQISRRATAKALLAGFGHLAISLRAQPGREPDTVPKGTRTAIRRQLLGLLSHGRARKLDAALEGHEDGLQLREEEGDAWTTIRTLPAMHPPERLVDDSENHLRAGQEAQEVRIATWSFRFMQVTVPVFILIFITIILLPAISRSREQARRAAGEANLRSIGEALLGYSAQSPGNHLPPMKGAGIWAPDLSLLYPRYIKDPALLVRPSLKDPDLVKAMVAALTASPPDYATAQGLFARSYVYTGYVMQSANDLETFLAALRTVENLDLNAKIETPSKDFFRLGRGVEIFFTTKYNDPEAAAQTRARIPVMFETFDVEGFDLQPDGANVLYLDGHVEYVRFGEAFPVNEAVRELLGER